MEQDGFSPRSPPWPPGHQLRRQARAQYWVGMNCLPALRFHNSPPPAKAGLFDGISDSSPLLADPEAGHPDCQLLAFGVVALRVADPAAGSCGFGSGSSGWRRNAERRERRRRRRRRRRATSGSRISSLSLLSQEFGRNIATPCSGVSGSRVFSLTLPMTLLPQEVACSREIVSRPEYPPLGPHNPLVWASRADAS